MKYPYRLFEEEHMAEVKLLLVDDHEVVRTGLRMLLENQPNILIVGEANTGGRCGCFPT